MQLKANLLLVIVTMFWGMSYMFMVMGLETLEVFNTVALRSLIAFILAGLIFYKKLMKLDKKIVLYGLIQGFFLVGAIGFPMIGVMTTPTANAGFLVSLTVVLVPIMTSIIDKKLPTRTVCIAIICTMIGIIILTFNSSLTLQIGDIFCLLTAFSYSIYIVLNGKFTKNVDSLAFGIYQMGFAAIISGCICLLFETPQIPSTSNSWIAVLGLGILCSAFGFIGQTVAQQYTTPTHTGLIFSLEPIFAAIFAIIFLGESITIQLIIGGLFIFGGNIIAQLEHFKTLKVVQKSNDTLVKETI
ncbi:multidrug transporter [Ureibacillus massiliensis 4400831 = CIP 108448 = CCUG 49529]|uniref:Multidrug transporter n=1 Tax=Ureibacillus massiliensis 4400831 = CIP 108448 = CCUG 49529 TaxID=1211035 RepID=A0A0A3J0L1_9BACL|nr:DMT family transporter [Ureibacillus massiliensis]KGR90491.1 multidrug transporter [Ureibacillus massiliensis 4400831 = CIP 108448 = CCUG 49529]